MKKFLPCLTAVAVLLAFASCNKTEESNHSGGYTSISGVIQDMPTEADEYVVKAFIYGDDDDLLVDECVVGANGKFTIDLPATINTAYLESFIDWFGDDAPFDMNLSDPNVKVAEMYLELHSDDVYVDGLTFCSLTSIAYPVFSNSACKATGSPTIDGLPMSVNMELVPGWNWAVSSISLTGISAGSKLGSGMKWYLDNDLEGDSE